jgi:hypothetical protein
MTNHVFARAKIDAPVMHPAGQAGRGCLAAPGPATEKAKATYDALLPRVFAVADV